MCRKPWAKEEERVCSYRYSKTVYKGGNNHLIVLRRGQLCSSPALAAGWRRLGHTLGINGMCSYQVSSDTNRLLQLTQVSSQASSPWTFDLKETTFKKLSKVCISSMEQERCFRSQLWSRNVIGLAMTASGAHTCNLLYHFLHPSQTIVPRISWRITCLATSMQYTLKL